MIFIYMHQLQELLQIVVVLHQSKIVYLPAEHRAKPPHSQTLKSDWKIHTSGQKLWTSERLHHSLWWSKEFINSTETQSSC